MKYSTDKKQTIILYILEKIASNTKSISKVVSETFDISTNTVHSYIKELLADGIIKKQKRGEYELVTTLEIHSFSRQKGELESDTYPFEVCLEKKLSHLAENINHIWIYALSEMVNNVIDHSNADDMHITVKQDYLTTSVLIIDNGIGIFKKIKDHFSLPTLDEAICELFKGKLTTDEANHSGEEIFFTSKMMDGFLISSGGKVFTSSKFEDESIIDINDSSTGTCVFMSLSNFTQKTAKEIFDEYSNTHGAFATTRIPLKNVFDSAPVSRSQAKRICNRLDKFEEVILDFKDIPWMGQGFAHQLFVLFKKAHPEVSISTINMNESVESMYNHVIRSV